MPDQLNLLKRIISTDEIPDYQVDLSEIERIITRTLPETLEKNAPPNFAELYFDFKQEYERFKEFILFDKLIGRNVVALGGMFSSGKSSFLNSLLGEELLPSDITPSTSVPAYLIHDTESIVYGINAFESKIIMQPEEVSLIAHGFGKDGNNSTEITLGHLLRSLFISSSTLPFQHIALLDTPGYTKSEKSDHSKKTDEKMARTQLNSANFILWFVPIESGAVSNSDIEFLRSLNPAIPKLIIVSKADKVPFDQLDEIVNEVRKTLKLKKIQVVDVLVDSIEEPEDYDREKILDYMKNWDKAISQSRFAYNFKVLFTKCKDYYEQLILERRKYLSRIRKSVVYSDHEFVNTFLDELNQTTVAEINALKRMEEAVSELSAAFFEEIRKVSSIVGIDMPEPTEIDLIDDELEGNS